MIHEHPSVTNLRPLPFDPKYHYKDNSNNIKLGEKNKARIINECFQSDEYRKIRTTYYDAGETQVFNSLWYPRPHLEYGTGGDDENGGGSGSGGERKIRNPLPLLGIDLIQFRDRFLVVIDFQPLTEKGEQSEGDITTMSMDMTFQQQVEKLWGDIPSILKGKMSNRFYDEAQFFSDHMIFGRFSRDEGLGHSPGDSGVIHDKLWDAFQKYVLLYMDMVDSARRETTTDEEVYDLTKILQRQKEYDIYSAERDPAHGLFVRVFGTEFATGFMTEFLFSLSSTKKEDD